MAEAKLEQERKEYIRASHQEYEVIKKEGGESAATRKRAEIKKHVAALLKNEEEVKKEHHKDIATAVAAVKEAHLASKAARKTAAKKAAALAKLSEMPRQKSVDDLMGGKPNFDDAE